MKCLFLALLIVPWIASAQTIENKEKEGIKFLSEASWENILAKAKIEHKNIFVDAYATWCGPCKAMDQQIYPMANVGEYINERFISVKLQMDSTANDGPAAKKSYELARFFKDSLNVTEYPTYLFFDENGLPIHKGVGLQNASDFLNIAKVAAEEKNRQFFTLIRKYKQGTLDAVSTSSLVDLCYQLGDVNTRNFIVNDFIKTRLPQQITSGKKFDSDDLNFVSDFGTRLNQHDFIVKYLLNHTEEIEALPEGKGRYYSIIAKVVNNTLYIPALENAKKINLTPNFKIIREKTRRIYGNYIADRMDITAQANWFLKEKRWVQYTAALTKQINKYDLPAASNNVMGLISLNNSAMSIFNYSNKTSELKAALNWIDRALKIDSKSVAVIDTKANLLYKLGNIDIAITTEKSILDSIAPTDQGVMATIKNMQAGKITWKIPNNRRLIH